MASTGGSDTATMALVMVPLLNADLKAAAFGGPLRGYGP